MSNDVPQGFDVDQVLDKVSRNPLNADIAGKLQAEQEQIRQRQETQTFSIAEWVRKKQESEGIAHEFDVPVYTDIEAIRKFKEIHEHYRDTKATLESFERQYKNIAELTPAHEEALAQAKNDFAKAEEVLNGVRERLRRSSLVFKLRYLSASEQDLLFKGANRKVARQRVEDKKKFDSNKDYVIPSNEEYNGMILDRYWEDVITRATKGLYDADGNLLKAVLSQEDVAELKDTLYASEWSRFLDVVTTAARDHSALEAIVENIDFLQKP